MIEVLEKGLLTTVQDGGRRGHRQIGVPVCGAMDMSALALANILAGNAWDEAALEVTGQGPALYFHRANAFALAGGDFAPTLDGVPIEMGRAYIAPVGSTLALGAVRSGFRAYIAVSGGLDIPLMLDSRSTCLTAGFGGLEGRALQIGDRLGFRAPRLYLPGLDRRAWAYPIGGEAVVRAIPGPQEAHFSAEGLETFFSGTYTITGESSRMGYRTKGPAIAYAPDKGPNIISDGIAPGAVQVPDGQPIVLMADRQTVGGYAKIAHVITADLPIIAQLRPGDSLRFRRTHVSAAQAALRDWARKMGNVERELAYTAY